MRTSYSLRWVGVSFAAIVVACAATAPPRELIERHDHGGLATWYDHEATRLRGKAEDMRRMAEDYAKPSYQPSPKESKAQLIAHCQLFTEYYTKAAEEAQALAKLHREQEKAIP